jgi:uncharacterized membrane protein
MSKFAVIVFPNEVKAFEGTRALKELDAEGNLTLYGMAVIAKDAEGRVKIRESADAGPLGTAVGALVGSLVGVLAGPAGVIVGGAGGTLAGSFFDLFNYGVGYDFISKVSREIGNGKTAIVAEIAESWMTPLNTRMEALGGTVLRTWRADFEDEQIAYEIDALNADFEQLEAEYAQAAGEAKAKIEARLTRTKADIKQAQVRLEKRLDAMENQTNAKIAALEKQLAAARADQKEKVKQRIAALRADYDRRSGKLKQALALTKEALTP